MKMTQIPKRRFALEEKDLSVEADENNKIAEEKENRFVAKIQQEALEEIPTSLQSRSQALYPHEPRQPRWPQ